MDDDGYDLLAVRIPRGAIDGAVDELTMEADGIITAQIRIPGPAVP